LLYAFFTDPFFLLPKLSFDEDAIAFAMFFDLQINRSIFINMLLTEQEKKDILSKYSNDTSDELLNHLKRAYPVDEYKSTWMEKPIKSISIDGKSQYISNNKKYIVSKISNELEDNWGHLGTQLLRRTVKKFIDGIRL